MATNLNQIRALAVAIARCSFGINGKWPGAVLNELCGTSKFIEILNDLGHAIARFGQDWDGRRGTRVRCGVSWFSQHCAAVRILDGIVVKMRIRGHGKNDTRFIDSTPVRCSVDEPRAPNSSTFAF
jgi:hypothetical protein